MGNGSLRPGASADGADDRGPAPDADLTALRARVDELEALCADLLARAADLNLPQPLLLRLHGAASRKVARMPVTSDVMQATPPPLRRSEALAIPDIRLTDRPLGDDLRSRAAANDLQPLNERRRVLVVDDDPMMLEVLTRILQRENYELVTATSGPEALRKVSASEPVDLLITDYAMPEMKGRELAERMRAQFADVRVLYQTGFSDMLFENRAELEDHAAFLEKPFTARGLREAARYILFGAINP